MEYFLGIEDALRSYLLASTRNHHEAADLLQDVSVVLWEKFSEFDQSRSFRAWAFGVARMQTLAWRRDHARERVLFSNEAVEKLAETACDLADDVSARRVFLQQCIEKLGEDAKKAVEMRFSGLLPLAQIAKQFQRSEGSIRVMMVRIRKSLRQCVEHAMAKEKSVA
jgi:RNA polymerase sigma-70 factor (ECF subfamily)